MKNISTRILEVETRIKKLKEKNPAENANLIKKAERKLVRLRAAQ